MKKGIIIIMILFSIVSFSQLSTLDINSKINEHLKEFRSIVGKDANVFIDFDFNQNITLQEHDYILPPYINPKKLKSKNNFMVKFIILKENEHMILRAVNFRIKKTKRQLEFVNLMNGKDYKW